jgi:hypothetical protein
MSADWIGTVATAAVGTVGIAFTWLTGKQARDHADRREQRQAEENARAQTIAFFSEIAASARRVQRASYVWTEDPTQMHKDRFGMALDEYGVLAAQARLTQDESVWEKVLDVESAFRRHRESDAPILKRGDPRFRLEPLIEVLRDAVPPATQSG